jgi:hypothetical protein
VAVKFAEPIHMSTVTVVQDDSNLLSVFPWHIIFKRKEIKLLTEYESVTQNLYFL